MRSDAECVERSKCGDHAAFAELIRRYQKAVHHLAMRILAHSEDADDATQETFVRAFRHLQKFDTSRSFKAWLMGIAVRQCATLARARSRCLETSLETEMEDVAAHPLDDVRMIEMRRDIRKAILRLPMRQRVAFVMFAQEERSMIEIAETMNCSVGSVKTHIHRARMRLRQELQHMVKGGEPNELQTVPKQVARTSGCEGKSSSRSAPGTRFELQGMR